MPELNVQNLLVEGLLNTVPEVFAAEQECIFTRQWFCAGHISRIPNPGNYFVLDAYGKSILILRNQNEEIRLRSIGNAWHV